MILQFPTPRASLLLSHHLCQILLQPTETPFQRNPRNVFHQFPYFVLPHSTTRYHKYWINKTIRQVKPVKFIIIYIQVVIPYVSNTLPIEKLILKSRFSLKIRQQGQQQLYLQYKVC